MSALTITTMFLAIMGGGLSIRIHANSRNPRVAGGHTTQACLSSPHSDFVNEFKLDDDCTKGYYPRSCLTSSVPVWAPYNQIRTCFSCCMKVWVAKLGLDKNFAHHSKIGHLVDEDKTRSFNHTIDEIILTPNSLQKFAHVAFVQTPRSKKSPTYEGFFNEDYTEVDPPLHRPCVEVEGKQCVVPRGGLILWRAFEYVDDAARSVSSWAKHSNFSILLEGDVAHGNADYWESFGGRVFRTNPMVERRDLDRGFYPLGMDAHWDTEDLETAFSEIGESQGGRDKLLFCSGMQTIFAKHRIPIIEALEEHGFDCNQDKLARHEYVHRLGQAKFVASPKGVGNNCYRTWEALTAGAIPIVSWYPGIEDLYEGLPVLISRDFSEITTTYLEDQWKRLRTNETLSLSKAFLPYWLGTLFAELLPNA